MNSLRQDRICLGPDEPGASVRPSGATLNSEQKVGLTGEGLRPREADPRAGSWPKLEPETDPERLIWVRNERNRCPLRLSRPSQPIDPVTYRFKLVMLASMAAITCWTRFAPPQDFALPNLGSF